MAGGNFLQKKKIRRQILSKLRTKYLPVQKMTAVVWEKILFTFSLLHKLDFCIFMNRLGAESVRNQSAPSFSFPSKQIFPRHRAKYIGSAENCMSESQLCSKHRFTEGIYFGILLALAQSICEDVGVESQVLQLIRGDQV